MGWLNKLFKGEDKSSATKASKKEAASAVLTIQAIERLTEDAVKVIFDVPAELKKQYNFIPGQYLNLVLSINGKEERRSYSICSGVAEPLAIGIKKIPNGVVSGYFNEQAKVGDSLEVAFPIGNFTLPKVEGNYVAIVGGSGITPVLSIAKSVHESNHGKINILYGNREEKAIMFAQELADLAAEKVQLTHIFSDVEKEGVLFGMLTQENIANYLKNNLDLLKADGFYLCGPEQVIINAQEALKTFGVQEDKLFYELFTTPEKLQSTAVEAVANFEGLSKVTVILDGEEEVFDLASDGDTILEEAESHGMDAPYSCRGAVCCTCRAKVLEGSATMEKNFTLTDKEVEEGYILTCQAHPNSAEITITYDE